MGPQAEGVGPHAGRRPTRPAASEAAPSPGVSPVGPPERLPSVSSHFQGDQSHGKRQGPHPDIVKAAECFWNQRLSRNP